MDYCCFNGELNLGLANVFVLFLIQGVNLLYSPPVSKSK